MMKTILTLVTLLFMYVTAVAQPNSAVPKNIRAAQLLDNMFDANGLASTDNLWGIPLEPGNVVGNAYLNPEWKRTTLLLYDREKMIEGYSTRYEIDLDQFEIKTSVGTKVLSGKRVRSFVWVDSLDNTPHYFINGRDLKTEKGDPATGFLEVLAEGDLTLLVRTEVVVKEPTYNVQLDVGNRDTRIVKKRKYHYMQNNVVYSLPSGKKKMMAVFGDHAEAMQEFVKVNDLSLDSDPHMKHLFEHYNNLTVTN